MTTRLDRLVILLDTGSTSVVRETAAKQIADIQKAHPDELFNLLGRVVPYLKSKSWETRSAAAKALGGIVANAQSWDPNSENNVVKSEPDPANDDSSVAKVKTETDTDATGSIQQVAAVVKKEPDEQENLAPVKSEPSVTTPDGASDATAADSSASTCFLTFDKLDIAAVMKYGKKLLGSATRESTFGSDLDPLAKYQKMKENLFKRLGLAGEYVDEEPPETEAPTPNVLHRENSTPTPASESTPETTADGLPADMSNLSARQRNALKRKAKMMKAAKKVRVIDVAPLASPVQKAVKTEHKEKEAAGSNIGGDYNFTAQAQSDKLVVEHKAATLPSAAVAVSNTSVWPFKNITEMLLVDIFDPSWEIRHGASMGLREIIKHAGYGFGREYGKTKAENDNLNKECLEDLLCRISCVFALDRFGDYLADQVVAPIRESISQVLAVTILYVPDSSVIAMYKLLHALVFQKEIGVQPSVWEACHGGILGIKYLVACKHELVFSRPELLDSVLSTVIYGLANRDDDVRAVSASTLLPVAERLIDKRLDACNQLLRVLWDCLDDVKDDLSSSTSSIMDLLSCLCSFPPVLELMKQNAEADENQSFSKLVPRLFYLMRYTITSVRRSVVYALTRFATVDSQDATSWVDSFALRLCFQNILLEQNEDILVSSVKLTLKLIDLLHKKSPAAFTTTLQPHIEAMFRLTMTPIGIPRHPYPLDATLLLKPNGQPYVKIPVRTRGRGSRAERKTEPVQSSSSYNVDDPVLHGEVELVGEEVLMRSRLQATTILGKILSYWNPNELLPTFLQPIQTCLNSPYSSPVVMAASLLEELFKISPKEMDSQMETFYKLLSDKLAAPKQSSYRNLVSQLHVLPTLAVLVQGDVDAGPTAFSIADAERVLTKEFDRLMKLLPSVTKRIAEKSLNETKMLVKNEIDHFHENKEKQDIQCFSSIATAIVARKQLPKKLNSIIQSIMESIKKEQISFLQAHSASSMVTLVDLCYETNRQTIAEKIVKNLCAFVCMDTTETPVFYKSSKSGIMTLNPGSNLDIEEGNLDTLTMSKMKGKHETASSIAALSSLPDMYSTSLPFISQSTQKSAVILQRLGAQTALQFMASAFGSLLLQKVPVLNTCLFEPIREFAKNGFPAEVDQQECTSGQDLIDAMSILRFLVPNIDPSFSSVIDDVLPFIVHALCSEYSAVRFVASKCFAAICTIGGTNSNAMRVLIEDLLPLLNDRSSVVHRQGAIECIYHVVQRLGMDILPYVLFLIVSLLGRMSDADKDVRVIATTTFATLVKLVPLEAGLPDAPSLPAHLLANREEERKFLEQMLDPTKVEPFVIPVAIKANLRKYQQEGVSWLAFLNKYQLHGILCDDMGLGKTLQSICIIASDHHNRSVVFKEPEVRSMHMRPRWSFAHRPWPVLAYVGPPGERSRLRGLLEDTDVVITSYDICRNDIDDLKSLEWNYCILDEGHVIKNAKAKLTKAVKMIRAYHRLILSGTPVQNNVLELWSLFDFLMPGFLGTEKSFQERFVKPIASSRDNKSSPKEKERGALAMETLHKQVLPFLLRRLKEDVLADLPPKIIQDYYCEMSPLQQQLHDEFVDRLQVDKSKIDEELSSGKVKGKTHIFQALQYMRKLCNHPALILTKKHPESAAIEARLQKENSSIHDFKHAPKLTALRQLLLECNIGTENDSALGANGGTVGSAVSEHRVLIFCQLKDMLDIVENDVLRKTMPSVTYLRLDGSVDPNKRQEVVTRFNSDPSIDVLLLTTHVGGLGLNLTGADTVIFVEHDWNPMRDLQAMDRAHRIGQKKVVNVYRLITRGTLEEKIMGLQQFKLNVASTIVNQQNNGLASIGTDQILDLFNTSANDQLESAQSTNDDSSRPNAILEELGETWDESQYDEYNNLDGFISSLPKN
ncbi:TATA-binding protein associated factor Mot1 [Schizosaccharomyces japonicus yFS275]|uniref:TATA-binding protein associated factor Mot1 n=1 Tax=Schizosaccharomyces japonicus (strain yFS275 / FY16936) TaxID=402676 RepID=B6JW79_SCHJY|nr:TATA-binding protein associated factor Mot1 [Schizosaccharomyces japonicus yFS275]EEB05630.2 TATA-binding protein associated factor Mot1 [Schizosaccharomyces japonicus yFS275]